MATRQIDIEGVDPVVAYDYGTSKEKLVQDFKVVVADAEELLKATANQANEKVSEARVKFAEKLDLAKIRLAETETRLRGKSAEAARATESYVQENPWKALGVAGGLGFLLGLLVNRR
ncbi:MAG: DUF883 domain-containing protein [Burkholderiales bacterium]|nr:DUF883 domain-containing protein [Burkholderiales bacterium]